MSSWIETLSEKAFDNFKKITPGLVAIAILTGLLLFLPDTILNKMSLDQLPTLWKRIIGLAFLLSVALIGTILFFSTLPHLQSKLREKRTKEKLKKKIKSLSVEQRDILRELLQSENKNILLERNSGNTFYLLENMFIYEPQQTFNIHNMNNMSLLYVPQPWLLELYYKNPDIFEE